MHPMHDLHTWSRQRRVEARRRLVAERTKEDRETRFRPGRIGSALCGVLSLLR